jgi:hypothetical protein
VIPKVCNALAPFLTFSKSYIHAKAHNRLAITLDSLFKKMKDIHTFLGNFVASQIAIKYDIKLVYLFLLQVCLNPKKKLMEPTNNENNDTLFG